MQRKRIIIGNWKMNPSSKKEAEKLFGSISKNIGKTKTEVVIAPPFVYLETLQRLSKKIPLCVQNISAFESGAYTGEISGSMAYDCGARYVILGHSERRAMGETNEVINKKVKLALYAGLMPIVCIGETARDDGHEYFNVIKTQISGCLAGVNKDSVSQIIIAYEPVWALSSTVNRHDFVPSEFLEVKIFIKKNLSDMFGSKTKLPRIIYGGSARPDNTLLFLRDGQADGLLPGKDSLDPEKFLEIVKIAENV